MLHSRFSSLVCRTPPIVVYTPSLPIAPRAILSSYPLTCIVFVLPYVMYLLFPDACTPLPKVYHYSTSRFKFLAAVSLARVLPFLLLASFGTFSNRMGRRL